MAEKLLLDDGIIELEVNDRGLLRFNASDPNVYQRFLNLGKELMEMEKEYTAVQAQTPTQESHSTDDTEEAAEDEDVVLEQIAQSMDQLKEFDHKIKDRLAFVFGLENDFDQLLGSVNLMAFGRNGERVITNLLEALRPYLEDGAKQHRKAEANEAVTKAKLNRAQRRAKK